MPKVIVSQRKKIWILLSILALLIIGCKETKVDVEKSKVTPTENQKSIKVLMIIAHENFRDEEYQKPKEILSKAGAEIITASSNLETAKGMLGAKVKPDILLSDVVVKNFDAILFIGGSGAKEYWKNPEAHRIAQESVKQNKILGAICIAPVTLAYAGILKNKKATVYISAKDELESQGVTYTGKPVEKDGNIITANSPDAADAFGEKVKKSLLDLEIKK